MNRRKGWLWLAVGIVLAIGTGGLVFFLLQQQNTAIEQARQLAQNDSEPAVAVMQLPVAARPLTPGTLINPEDYLMKEFPLDLVPVTAITQTVNLDDQILVEQVGQGETFGIWQIAGDNALKISQRLPEGHVLFAFPIVDLMSQVNIIEDGDRIDLMLTTAVDSANGVSGASATGFTLQNIEVFRVLRPVVGEDTPDIQPIALMLLMKPEDAIILKNIKDSGGVIDFVLRSVVDEEPFTTQPINRDQMLDRYQFR